MSDRLAIDFGTTNTVISYWDKTEGRAKPLYIPGISRPARYLFTTGCPDVASGVYIIPSLIQYQNDGTVCRIGQAVLDANRNLPAAAHVFRNMRPDVMSGRRTFRLVGCRRISLMDAAADFLSQIIRAAVEVVGKTAGITFTAPLTASSNEWQCYRDWLAKLACAQGIQRVQLQEEPWAAAWGAGLALQPGQIYAFLDFGGSTLNGMIVLVDECLSDGRFLRIISQADDDLGGIDVDNWLAAEVLKQHGLWNSGAGNQFGAVAAACERARERLSVYDQAEIQVSYEGHNIQTVFTKAELTDILNANDFPGRIEALLRQTVKGAERLGYCLNSLTGVVLNGGLSNMPCVRQAVRSFFAGIPVYDSRPVDAVACGAATLAAGEDACGYIRHGYGLRYLAGEEYCYQTLVSSGLFYPSAGPVATIIIKASYNGQQQFGLFIYRQSKFGEQTGGICVNTDNPLIMSVVNPVEQGQAGLKVEFYVDGNRYLMAKIWDLSNGCVIAGNKPVAQLI